MEFPLQARLDADAPIPQSSSIPSEKPASWAPAKENTVSSPSQRAIAFLPIVINKRGIQASDNVAVRCPYQTRENLTEGRAAIAAARHFGATRT